MRSLARVVDSLADLSYGADIAQTSSGNRCCLREREKERERERKNKRKREEINVCV